MSDSLISARQFTPKVRNGDIETDPDTELLDGLSRDSSKDAATGVEIKRRDQPANTDVEAASDDQTLLLPVGNLPKSQPEQSSSAKLAGNIADQQIPDDNRAAKSTDEVKTNTDQDVSTINQAFMMEPDSMMIDERTSAAATILFLGRITLGSK